jgi:hypothetical protein
MRVFVDFSITLLNRCQFRQHFISSFLYGSVLNSFFYSYSLALYFLGQKDTGAKAVLKILLKLTTGVNFINILHTNFSYKRGLAAFSSYVLALAK